MPAYLVRGTSSISTTAQHSFAGCYLLRAALRCFGSCRECLEGERITRSRNTENAQRAGPRVQRFLFSVLQLSVRVIEAWVRRAWPEFARTPLRHRAWATIPCLLPSTRRGR